MIQSQNAQKAVTGKFRRSDFDKKLKFWTQKMVKDCDFSSLEIMKV